MKEQMHVLKNFEAVVIAKKSRRKRSGFVLLHRLPPESEVPSDHLVARTYWCINLMNKLSEQVI